MPTAYITHADCLRHEMGPGHPECPGRLSANNEQIRASGLADDLRCLEAPLANPDDINRVHDARYVEQIFARAPAAGYVQLDPDTAMNAHSLPAARRAAGAGILAVDEVMSGRAANAFCAVRPCGHHATAEQSMGFCIFNNVGVAAAYALEKHGLERVAIIDFDVHHGNGTEDIFSAPAWQERVLMASFFQHPFYPYSGSNSFAPNMINVPMPAGSGGEAAAGAGGLQAADDPHFGGFRCTSRRSPGRHGAHRGRLRVDDPRTHGVGRAPLAAPHRVNARGRL